MTDNRTTELLPCPFCGGEAFPNIELRKHWVECRECCAESGCYRTEAEAIAAWNKRPNEKTIFDWAYFAFALEHNDMFFEFIKELSNDESDNCCQQASRSTVDRHRR